MLRTDTIWSFTSTRSPNQYCWLSVSVLFWFAPSVSFLGLESETSRLNADARTNIKTINSTKLLGSGDITVQPTLVSGTNIQSINGSSILTSGDISLQTPLVSGTSIKTINSTSLLGSGDIDVQPTLVSGTNIKTINSTSLLGSGDIVISASPSGVAGAIQFSDGTAFASDAANLFWDDTNNRLGAGINVPTATLHTKGIGTTSATQSFKAENSTGTASLTLGDDGITTFAFPTGGKVYITGAVGPGETLLEARRTSGTLGGIILRSDGGGGSVASINGALDLFSTTGTDIGLYATTGIIKLGTGIKDMTAFNTGHQIKLGGQNSGSTARWVNYGWSPTYGNNFQAVQNASTPAVDTLSLNPFGGNVGVGAILPTAKLHTKGAGATSATLNLKSENSSGTASFNHYGDGTFSFVAESAVKWSMRDTFYELIAGSSIGVDRFITRTFQFGSNLSPTRFDGMQIINGAGTQSMTATSGDYRLLSIVNNHQTATANSFSPTSGTATLTHFQIKTDINQTGTATGRVVGIEYTPTLTSITGTHYGLLVRPTTFNGFGLGATLPTATVHIKGSGATSLTKSFNLENSDNSKSLIFDNAGNLMTNGQMAIGQTTAPDNSAIFEVESTTQGFLPPRMTNAQVLAIVTPVNGLMVYNTTIDHICVYQAGAWVKLNHSPM